MKFSLARVEQWNLGLSASAVAASLALATPHFATSLAAGAFLEAVNLGALRRSALRFFAGEMSRSWTGAFALRFLALAAAIFLTLRAGANPIALLIGMSIAMPAVLIDAWLNRPPILDPATLPVFLDDDGAEEAGLAGSPAGDWAEHAEPTDRWSWTGELFQTRLTPSALGATDAESTTSSVSSFPSPATAHSAPADTAPDETRR